LIAEDRRGADVPDVWLEVLVWDNLDLPDKLPNSVKRESMLRTSTSKRDRSC